MCPCIFLINQPPEGRNLFYRLQTRGTETDQTRTKYLDIKTINSRYGRLGLVLLFMISFNVFSRPSEQVLVSIPILQMITMMLSEKLSRLPGHTGSSKRGKNQDSNPDLPR